VVIAVIASLQVVLPSFEVIASRVAFAVAFVAIEPFVPVKSASLVVTVASSLAATASSSVAITASSSVAITASLVEMASAFAVVVAQLP